MKVFCCVVFLMTFVSCKNKSGIVTHKKTQIKTTANPALSCFDEEVFLVRLDNDGIVRWASIGEREYNAVSVGDTIK